jgi:hypothetical protein
MVSIMVITVAVKRPIVFWKLHKKWAVNSDEYSDDNFRASKMTYNINAF